MAKAAEAAPVAVIDLGSNSVRLVVYDALGRAPASRFNERHLCGVGREVARTGRLGATGRACVADSLKRFVAVVRGMGCCRLDIIATAAFRMAADGPEFIDRVARELAVEITVLSGPEEARYAALGIASGFHEPDGVVGDLGGGSVEFASLPVDAPASFAPVSLPLGALLISEALRDGIDAARRRVVQTFADAPDLRGAASSRAFYVVGGSWRALARARMAIMDHPLRVVHGYELSGAEAGKLGETMSRIDPGELSRIPGFPRRRAETVPPAGLLLAAAVEVLEPTRVIFSATGVREGRMFALLTREAQKADPLIAAAAELGRATARDPALADAMIAFSDGLLPGETPGHIRLRHAVCHVADSGWREHPETRAREAFLRLVQYPFVGLDHPARVTLALAVFTRYEGSHDDPALRRTLQLMDAGQQAWARALGQVLDLGLRLCAGVPAIAAACRLRGNGSTLELRADHPAVLPSDEAIRGRLRAIAATLGYERATITA